MAESFERLSRYFETATDNEMTLTFAQIEEIIGEPLPEAARTDPAWWGNDAGADGEGQAWRAHGWRSTGANLSEQKVAFAREG